jgi:hypothetical protein
LIDLKALAGALNLRVTLDELVSIEDEPRLARPWLWQVPCRYGHVCVWSTDALAAYCRANRLRPRLLAVPGARAVQLGDRECTIVFPAAELGTVTGILGARRRRVLSPEQRDRLVAAGERTRIPRGPEHEIGPRIDARESA